MTFKYGAFSGLTRQLPRVFMRGLILAELTHKEKKKKKEALCPSAYYVHD